MTDAATMTSQVPHPEMAVNQPRKPPTFHGDSFDDVEDWLELFERVASVDGWDETHKLCHVYFALEDFAKMWYENHEPSLTSWEEFQRQVIETFAVTDRKEKAEIALQARGQLTNETVAMYIEDMSRLFRRADPNMTEDKMLRHLIRGVKQKLFAVLAHNPPRTVTELRSEATAIEKTLEQRARQYSELSIE